MFPGAITQLSCVQRCHLECARRTQTLGVCVDVPLASHPGETERGREGEGLELCERWSSL